MKKFNIKSFICGLLVGTISVTTVFAAVGIKSATYSNSKVYFYENEVPLKNSLVAIVKDGSTDAQLYMPMRELLEYMNFNVEWNSHDSSVNLTMKGDNGYSGNNDYYNGTYSGGYDKPTSSISQDEADTRAIDIINRTGNWSYIEPYLPYMSPDGIKKVVEIYNSKHMNEMEHKNANDYINNWLLLLLLSLFLLADEKSNILRNYDYDAFGNERQIEGPDVSLDNNPFHYSGNILTRKQGLFV